MDANGVYTNAEVAANPAVAEQSKRMGIMAPKAQTGDTGIPELRGRLEYDEERDELVLRFKAAAVNAVAQPRPYTDKDGKSKSSAAFKLAVSGMIGDTPHKLSTGRMSTVSLYAIGE